ncbi:G-protein coupled receptors family 1 profile domain-containing protein [Madurella fahalii]|uniref:G-protein coupled receptors family 1 profile domain-containing protein n=1 Tax=Madurella fahalii TaxID=1157608 RepID=A0ABQ0G8Z7_9PEZI
MSPFVGVNGGVGWLESRDDDTRWMPLGGFNNKSRNGFFQSATNRTATQQMFLNDLRFSAARSIRTSTLILACFNIIAAFATALGILCDSYFRGRRNRRNNRTRRTGFLSVPEGEIYPLVLSIGIFVQSITFAGAQSTGLDNFFGRGCTIVSQLMLPAVFIAPYIQLVFGVEIAIRALRKQPFAPRGRYNVSVCLAIVGVLILVNFLVAAFDRARDFCLTSLFWFVSHYALLCFALLVAIAVIVLVCTIIIFVKLHRSIKIEVTSRVAASKMVYYLALAVISTGFMIPFFFSVAFMDRRGMRSNALTLSMVASVVANVSGLMTGGLYLFLKSNTLSTIGPRDKVGEYENRRARYKITRDESNDGNDDDDFDSRIMRTAADSRSLRRMDSDTSLISNEKEEEALDGKSLRAASTTYGRRSPGSLRSNTLFSVAATALMPKAPEPARILPASSVVGHMRKRSYSLFPNSTPAAKSSFTLLPATTYSPADALKPPPSMGNLANMRHRRDSSLVSSATVQIGLRLSSVDDMPPVVQHKVVTNDHEVHSLDCPNVLKELEMASHKRVALDGSATTPPLPPEAIDESLQRDPVKDARMKTLPPVPKANSRPAPDTAEQGTEEITLGPTVYTPESPTKVKLPSPKGVGFTTPMSKSANGASPRSPPVAPPPRRATGEITPRPTDAKGDWI